MKRVYWSGRKVSRPLILVVTALALGAVAVVEWLPRPAANDLEERKLAAARLAERGMEALKKERLRRGIPIEPDLDPAETGMIGTRETPTTSVDGHLASKRTSVNPNWAAVVLQMLHEGGVRPGDTVAIGCSGSFPALNLCTYAAVQALGARPIVVASVGASQFGANYPQWTWLDMERHLLDIGVLEHGAGAASRGGYADRALRMTDEGRRLIDDAIARNGLPQLVSVDFASAIDERMVVFDRLAGDQPVKAYVNVGGGTISVGTSVGKRMYDPGLNVDPRASALSIDSVMTRFAKRGVPLVHLVQIADLAREYELPIEPRVRPIAGTGPAFRRSGPDRIASTIAVVVVLGGVLLVTIRRRTTEADRPEEPKPLHVVTEPRSKAA